MTKQETVVSKKRGPKPTGKGTPIMLRLQPDLLMALDRFIAETNADTSRPEALRIAFRDWAIEHGYVGGDDEQGIKPADLNASNDD